MKKGKLFLTGLIAFAAGIFVSKNKWCQEKIQMAREKGEEVLGRCKCQKDQPTEEKAE